MESRKLNWNFVDWQWWVIGVGLTGVVTSLHSGVLEVGLQMMVLAMIVGGIILYVRRGILKVMKRR